jgi:hypothetical protein
VASVPSACQPLAELVVSLEQQYTDSAAKAAGLSGAQAWSALGQLGDVLAQLTDARHRFDQCVKTNSAALIGNVTVMDASGAGAAAGGQTAILWELADTGPTARDTTQVQAGTFGFKGPIPTSAAITLHSTDAPDLAGPDYRSGQLQGELGGQPLRLEMVYGPRLTLTAGVLQRLASQFPPTTQTLTGPATLSGLGPATLTVNSLTVVLADGSLTLTATGTLGAAALPTTPFSGSASLVALPSDAPDAGDLVQVILAGANPVQISLPSLPGLAAILGLLSPLVGNIAQSTLRAWLHQSLPGAIARGLALAQLPQPTTLSLRSLTIHDQGVAFQPAIGVVGSALSSFHPSPLPLP